MFFKWIRITIRQVWLRIDLETNQKFLIRKQFTFELNLPLRKYTILSILPFGILLLRLFAISVCQLWIRWQCLKYSSRYINLLSYQMFIVYTMYIGTMCVSGNSSSPNKESLLYKELSLGRLLTKNLNLKTKK